MAKNPFPLLIPCHRVVSLSGKGGGFSAFGGLDTQNWLLDRERRGFRYDAVEAVQTLAAQDSSLGKLMQQVGPLKLEIDTTRSPFQSLVRSITYQQLTGKAAATILGRVLGLFPEKDFPSPEDLLKVSTKALRGAGLSGAKVAAVKDLAQKTLDGVVPNRKEAQSLSDEELIERLVKVRGIGPWTVQMLLIFGLGRPDVFPADDLGIRKGYAILTGRKKLPEKPTMLRRSQRWRPYRSVASWYLWRFTEL
jgi:3-methyladenine DNA glycosylase/8-oxoguanine DNA glycosylase